MPIFKRQSPSADLVLIHQRCWADPALDHLMDLLEDHSRPPAERVDAALGHLAAQREDPEAQVQTMHAAAERLTGVEEAVRAASATARAASGADPRGAGRHRPPRQHPGAGGLGGPRRRPGEHGQRGLVPHVPRDPGGGRRRRPERPRAGPERPRRRPCAAAVGAGSGTAHRRVVAPLRDRAPGPPHAVPVHRQMLQALCKKWYGSREPCSTSPGGWPRRRRWATR